MVNDLFEEFAEESNLSAAQGTDPNAQQGINPIADSAAEGQVDVGSDSPEPPVPPKTEGTVRSRKPLKGVDVLRMIGKKSLSSKKEDELATYGIGSASVEFISTLKHPTKKEMRAPITGEKTRVDADGKTKNVRIDDNMIVGYLLKLHDDVVIPTVTLDVSQGYAYDNIVKGADGVGIVTMVPHKKGETVQVTKLEALMLIASPKFAGRFTGGTQKVRLAVQAKFIDESKAAKPEGQTLDNLVLSRPALQADGGEALWTKATLIGSANADGSCEIADAYKEKFGMLSRIATADAPKVARRTGSKPRMTSKMTSKTNGFDERQAIAESFRQAYAEKFKHNL